jgi:hypothetical protein|tara:strand:- start:731 stop:1132 length:402 start_codon:yes stop_codon:yes gene_type:complete
MRVQYESSKDRTTERQLINKYISSKALKLPKAYGFDFMVMGDGLPVVWEVKKRNKRYNTWFVSMLKLLKAQHYEGLGIKAYGLIEIEGLPYTLRFTKTPYSIGWGGRSDRGDADDQEPMVHYSIDDLKLIDDS